METTKPRPAKGVRCAPVSQGNRRAETGVYPAAGAVAPTPDDVQPGVAEDSHPEGVKTAAADGRGGVHSSGASASAFIALVNQGVEAWSRAGRMLVAWKEKEPDCFRLIIMANPWMSIAHLLIFERIGKKTLHPRVLLLPPTLANRASMLSYAAQENLCAKPWDEVRNRLRKKGSPRTHSAGVAPATKLPTVGYFKVSVVDGDAVAEKAEPDPWAVPLVLDVNNSVTLQILSRHVSAAGFVQKPAKLAVTKELSAVEKRYREFRNNEEEGA